MIKSKFIKILSAFLLMLALPVATLTGNVYSSLSNDNENSTAISNGENSYSSVEEYQAATKQDKKSSGVPLTTIEDHDDSHDDWNELNSTSSATLTDGNWVLTESFTSDSRITIQQGADVTLCLNGETLTFNTTSGIYIYNSSGGSETSFTLHDCSSGETGTITFSNDVASSNLYGIYVSNSASNSTVNVTMNGGTFDLYSEAITYGFYILNSAGTNPTTNVVINDGTIKSESSNTTSTDSAYGIRVSHLSSVVNGAINVTMNGGTIDVDAIARDTHGIVYRNQCSISLLLTLQLMAEQLMFITKEVMPTLSFTDTQGLLISILSII